MPLLDRLVQTMLSDGSLRLAYSLVFLAGLSEGFGTQSAVLFVNRVSRRNFALNLLFSGVLTVLGALAWILSVWLICRFILHVPQQLPLIARLITVGYIPLLFSFLIIIPYLGPGIGVVLHLVTFTIVVLAMQAKLGFPLPVTFSTALGGGLFVQLLRLVTNRPLAFVDRWLWRTFSGRDQKLDLDEIPLVLAEFVPTQAGSKQRQ